MWFRPLVHFVDVVPVRGHNGGAVRRAGGVPR